MYEDDLTTKSENLLLMKKYAKLLILQSTTTIKNLKMMVFEHNIIEHNMVKRFILLLKSHIQR